MHNEASILIARDPISREEADMTYSNNATPLESNASLMIKPALFVIGLVSLVALLSLI